MSRSSVKFSWLAGTATAVALLAVFLSLLGYGGAAAIESRFGVPRGLLYDSPMSLLNLSSYAVMGAVALLDEPSEAWMTMSGCLLLITMIATLIALTGYGYWLRDRSFAGRFKEKAAVSESLRFLERCRGWLGERKFCFLPLGLNLVVWGIYIGACVLMLLIAITPLLGFVASKHHFQQWAVGAEQCAPVLNRAQRLEIAKADSVKEQPKVEKTARIVACLALWRDTDQLAWGRLVTSTSSHIVLFNPDSGVVVAEPLGDISIRTYEPQPSTVETRAGDN